MIVWWAEVWETLPESLICSDVSERETRGPSASATQLCPFCRVPKAPVRHRNQRFNIVPVLTACQPTENGVLAWMTYMVMGLWLSGPGLQESWAVVSVISSIVTASGGPGGPEKEQDPQKWSIVFKCPSKWPLDWMVNTLFNCWFIHPQVQHLTIPFWIPVTCLSPSRFWNYIDEWNMVWPPPSSGSLQNRKN